MTEFLILSAVWLVFLVFISKKGMAHLLRPHVGVTFPLLGGVCGALLEALPTTPMSPGFTIRTLIAVLAGVFAGRLFGKVARLWAMGHEKRAAAAGAPVGTPRLVHPMIAAGMFVAGVPSLWHVVSSNHSLLEEQLTPRDEKTGVAHGYEEIRLEGKGPNAALLIHGLYSAPADFGDLPARLETAGWTVAAPLLPGHGTKPDDLDRVWAEDWRRAVRAEHAALAAKHERVVVVGFSMGGTLAVLAAAERPPAALVIANPYVGHLTTPSWSPIAYDSLLGPLSRVVRRRIFEGEGQPKLYRTQSLHAARQCRDLAEGLGAAAAKIACPTLLVVGEADAIVPAPATFEWAKAHLPKAKVVRLPASGHPVFLGPDADRAVEDVVRFLGE